MQAACGRSRQGMGGAAQVMGAEKIPHGGAQGGGGSSGQGQQGKAAPKRGVTGWGGDREALDIPGGPGGLCGATCVSATSTQGGLCWGKAASFVMEQGHLPDSAPPGPWMPGAALPEPPRCGSIAHLGVAWRGFPGLLVAGDCQEEVAAVVRPDKAATVSRARPRPLPRPLPALLREKGGARAETPSGGWKRSRASGCFGNLWRSRHSGSKGPGQASKGSQAAGATRDLKWPGRRREFCLYLASTGTQQRWLG